jgi:hypothetical protein
VAGPVGSLDVTDHSVFETQIRYGTWHHRRP